MPTIGATIRYVSPGVTIRNPGIFGPKGPDPPMEYEQFERAEEDYTAETVGLSPGVAGVYMEHKADVFCPTCGRDILGDGLMDRLKSEDLGYDHPKSDELGNVAVVLSTEEWDCPGANCGHCGIQLDTKVIHYDGVCGEHCPEN